jgi:hypothetical protein
MHQRQESYLARSRSITCEVVERWTWQGRFWNNTIAMLSPVL